MPRLFTKFWFILLLFFGFSCRIGEADKPGPVPPDQACWSLGICNPSGLLGKSTLLADVNTDIIAVSETHLTSVSSSCLQTSLRTRSAYKYLVTGHPMCPRTTASAAGQYAGVALTSKQPFRALCSDWPQDMYETGRVQIAGSLVGQQWVTGAIIYGYPQSKFHHNAQEKTEGILAHAFDHMTTFAQGPRYMAGDWNYTRDQLAVTQHLLAAGWQEVQTLEYLRTGTQPRCTCKGKTQKDFPWLSPELVHAFQGMSLDDETFPDHSVLKATFTTNPICVLCGTFGQHRKMCRGPKSLTLTNQWFSSKVIPQTTMQAFGNSMKPQHKLPCNIPGPATCGVEAKGQTPQSKRVGPHHPSKAGVGTHNLPSMVMMSSTHAGSSSCAGYGTTATGLRPIGTLPQRNPGLMDFCSGVAF